LKQHIPNAITLVNLLFGICAVMSTLYGQFEDAAICVFFSLVADFADGFVARMLKVQSPLGVQLDSLADMVSFGVVPGAMLYMLMVKSMQFGEVVPLRILPEALPAFAVTLFAAVRLAKFNIDERQTEGFIGLATPSVTMFVTGLLLMYQYNSFGLGNAIANGSLIYLLSALLSVLMISELPMFGLKFKSFGWKGNEIRLTFVAVSLIALVLLREMALPLIIASYVLLNLLLKYLVRS
jgi:CDP-diacylglycerol---serine O-phosphatidyltransferase